MWTVQDKINAIIGAASLGAALVSIIIAIMQYRQKDQIEELKKIAIEAGKQSKQLDIAIKDIQAQLSIQRQQSDSIAAILTLTNKQLHYTSQGQATELRKLCEKIIVHISKLMPKLEFEETDQIIAYDLKRLVQDVAEHPFINANAIFQESWNNAYKELHQFSGYLHMALWTAPGAIHYNKIQHEGYTSKSRDSLYLASSVMFDCIHQTSNYLVSEFGLTELNLPPAAVRKVPKELEQWAGINLDKGLDNPS